MSAPQLAAGIEATLTSVARPATSEASTDLVRPARVVKVIHPPSFSLSTVFTGLRTLLQYSDLLYTLSLFRLSVRYKQSALGWTWAEVPPLALRGIYTVIFTRVTNVTTGGATYPV